ncbi:hypothetical protein [Neochlamydia sp. AcF95]|uniref:hypothetical protein n=1 Tax=Neochlamydia sp. AcF95 TaxID=2795734 RepID=UPI001BC95A4B|nr:hypothetical protein [Neochlamydia sp. AcF95]MBS4170345.1 Uncharacterized protein [Neochlamydia sp. AcF95]
MTINKINKSEIDKALKGNWKVIGCQLNGLWLPSAIFENFIYSFPDVEHFKLAWGDLTFPNYVGGFPKSDKGKISINVNFQPYQIDLIPHSGPFAEKAFKGIFELDHDILKANFAFPEIDRPNFFSAKQGHVYEIWQRM